MIGSHVEKIETLHDAHFHTGWCTILQILRYVVVSDTLPDLCHAISHLLHVAFKTNAAFPFTSLVNPDSDIREPDSLFNSFSNKYHPGTRCNDLCPGTHRYGSPCYYRYVERECGKSDGLQPYQ